MKGGVLARLTRIDSSTVCQMTFFRVNAVALLIAYAFAFQNVEYVVIVDLETRSKLHRLIGFG